MNNKYILEAIPSSRNGVVYRKTIVVEVPNNKTWFDITIETNGIQAAYTLSPENAVEIRDILLKHFPVEAIAPVKKCPFGFDDCDGSCNAKSAAMQTTQLWEVIADGIDRIAVPNGWIYQNVDGNMLFVADAACKS